MRVHNVRESVVRVARRGGGELPVPPDQEDGPGDQQASGSQEKRAEHICTPILSEDHLRWALKQSDDQKGRAQPRGDGWWQ